jgi:hypothetical protein
VCKSTTPICQLLSNPVPGAKAKVGDFHIALGIKQDVVSFQVSVHNASVVAIFDCTCDLLEYASGLIVFVMLQELSSTLVLHDQVDTVHSFHYLKQFDDVRVVQCLHYRYF